MNSIPDLATAARHLGERYAEVQLIYLFGSQVSGAVGPTSDVDIAVQLTESADIYRLRSELAHELTKELETDQIDLVVLNEAPIELSFHVIADGIRLYERSVADRVECEAYIMSRYGDYLPTLRQQRKEIVQGGDSNEKRIQRYRETFRRTERTLGSLRRNSE